MRTWFPLARLGLLAGAMLLGGCALLGPSPDKERELAFAPPAGDPLNAPVLESVAPQVIANGSREKKRIALTFDACSTHKPSQYDERVIRTLINLNVPATLFLGGKWMEEHPHETRLLAWHPLFELGNHTFLHPHPRAVTPQRLRHEIEWTQNVMYTLTGRYATLFRAPYGEIDESVVNLVADMGLTTVQFDLPSGDPDRRASKKRLIEHVTRRARNGSIVVMHMNGRGRYTADALPEIVKRLRAKGYEFVTVGQLIAPEPGPQPVIEHVRVDPDEDSATR